MNNFIMKNKSVISFDSKSSSNMTPAFLSPNTSKSNTPSCATPN